LNALRWLQRSGQDLAECAVIQEYLLQISMISWVEELLCLICAQPLKCRVFGSKQSRQRRGVIQHAVLLADLKERAHIRERRIATELLQEGHGFTERQAQ
jgi:hypothetical protein